MTCLSVVNNSFVWKEQKYTASVDNNGRLKFKNAFAQFIPNVDRMIWEDGKYDSIKGVIHYVSQTTAHVTYILLTEPYNCLLTVVCPIGTVNRFKVLETSNTDLSIWDSLTYHDSAEQMGIHFISENGYSLGSGIEANTIPDWEITAVDSAAVFKPEPSDESGPLQTYKFNDLPKFSTLYFHFLINRNIDHITFIYKQNEHRLQVEQQNVFMNNGQISDTYHYTCLFENKLLDQNGQFTVKYPVRFMSNNNLTVCLSHSKYIKYTPINEIIVNTLTPFSIAYCFLQQTASHFGSHFVSNILSKINISIDKSTILVTCENKALAQVLSDKTIVIGKQIDSKTFETSNGERLVFGKKPQYKFINSGDQMQSDDANRILSGSGKSPTGFVTKVAVGILCFILLVIIFFK
jgi:hypothetical protein